MRLAVAQNESAAQNHLGIMYKNGNSVLQPDFKEAKRLFELATEQGNVQARYNLAILYLEGKGVAKDLKKAIAMLQACGDIPEALFKLGELFQYGIFFKQDFEQAIRYYNKSFELRPPAENELLKREQIDQPTRLTVTDKGQIPLFPHKPPIPPDPKNSTPANQLSKK